MESPDNGEERWTQEKKEKRKKRMEDERDGEMGVCEWVREQRNTSSSPLTTRDETSSINTRTHEKDG